MENNYNRGDGETQHGRQIANDERQVNKCEMMYMGGGGKGREISGWDTGNLKEHEGRRDEGTRLSGPAEG